MSDHDLTMLVATINNLYTRYGLSGPVRLRDAAKGWLGIPIEDVLAQIELHFLHHIGLYGGGSGDAYFHLVQRAVDQLRDRHLFAGNAANGRAAAAPTEGRPRPARGAIRKLYNRAGGFDAFDDSDESEVDVSRVNAPQPRMDRRPERVEWQGLDGDDDPKDA